MEITIKISSKPVVRVTQIEQFRRWLRQSEYDNYEITEQSVIDSVTGTFEGNVKTRIGTAFHGIVECGRCGEPKEAGERKYLYYGREVTEPVPCGFVNNVGGHDVVFDEKQVQTALAYRNEHAGAFHELRTLRDFGPAVVTGCADIVDGIEIRDIKTKFAMPQDAVYTESCQWRYYLQLFGVDVFRYDLFVFEGYKEDVHSYDVRGLNLVRHTPPITMYRYERLHEDNENLLREFLAWAEEKKLTQYLTYNSIER